MTDHASTAEITTLTCPECGERLPVARGYVTWCGVCGWNLRPKHPDERRSLFEAISANFGERLGRSLLIDVLREGASKPATRPRQYLSFVLAAWVQIPGITLGLAGLWLIWQSRLHWWAFPLGLICLGLATSVVRVQFDHPSQDYLPVQHFPKLYKLVNCVAASLGAKPVERIYPRPWFNASASREGWRGRSSLYLGLPLWAVLDDSEKLALLAHELAHQVNGDPSRGALIGGALDVLSRWYAMLRPAVSAKDQPGLPRLAMVPVNVVLSVISLVVWLHALALAALLWRDQQRAEYYADALAAKLCGPEAVLSLLEKLHFTRTFQSSFCAWHLNRDLQQESYFAYLRRRIALTPVSELERIRQVELLENSRLDTRHPPTAYRIHALQALRISHSMPLSISNLDWESVESELAQVYQIIQSELSKNYERGLYQ